MSRKRKQTIFEMQFCLRSQAAVWVHARRRALARRTSSIDDDAANLFSRRCHGQGEERLTSAISSRWRNPFSSLLAVAVHHRGARARAIYVKGAYIINGNRSDLQQMLQIALIVGTRMCARRDRCVFGKNRREIRDCHYLQVYLHLSRMTCEIKLYFLSSPPPRQSIKMHSKHDI